MLAPAQIRAARAMLRINQQRLADMSGLSKPAINSLENGDTDPRVSTVTAVKAALEWAGIEFTTEGHPGLRGRPMTHLEQGVGELLMISWSGDSIPAALKSADAIAQTYAARAQVGFGSTLGELRQAFRDHPGSHTAAGDAIVKWMDHKLQG